MRALGLLMALALAVPASVASPSGGPAIAAPWLPVAAGPDQPSRANAEIVRDTFDLAFEMESGRHLSRLSRFEGPVRVRLAGEGSDLLKPDLAALLQRLRAEAGLDIAMAEAAKAQIVVEMVPSVALSAAVPDAACFVVPGASSWTEFLAERGSPQQDWVEVQLRTEAAVFVPAEASLQDLRDCLHEEIAQALGPLNDLYRLPDSVFNDDNIHVTLTSFDMLVLRVLNDPSLRSGMTRDEVAARLPAILSSLNPEGDGIAADPGVSRSWMEAIGAALSRDRLPTERRRAAEAAVAMARGGASQGLALLALGRSEAGQDPDAARVAFAAALRAFDSSPVTMAQAAQARLQLAALALGRRDGSEAERLAAAAIPVAEAQGDAALLATLLFVRAEALDLMGLPGAAEAARLDGLGWASYGFTEVGAQRRLGEVRSLVQSVEASR